jgi:hypothetical protein
VTIQAVIGTDIVELSGAVARMIPYESPHFPEALVGVRFADPGSAAVRRIVRIAGSISGLVEP